jgi:hypothetical protein
MSSVTALHLYSIFQLPPAGLRTPVDWQSPVRGILLCLGNLACQRDPLSPANPDFGDYVLEFERSHFDLGNQPENAIQIFRYSPRVLAKAASPILEFV